MSGNEAVREMSRVWRARRARGVTLVEVLIVVAIIAMVAGGVAVFALPKYKEAQIKNAETGARIVRTAVQQWQAANNETSDPSIVNYPPAISHGMLDCLVPPSEWCPVGASQPLRAGAVSPIIAWNNNGSSPPGFNPSYEEGRKCVDTHFPGQAHY